MGADFVRPVAGCNAGLRANLVKQAAATFRIRASDRGAVKVSVAVEHQAAVEAFSVLSSEVQ
jgi:hypothetical protein